MFGRVLHAGDDVGDAARAHDPQRPDLVDAGIAGVHLHENVVAADFALEQSPQIVLDSFSLCVHPVAFPSGRWTVLSSEFRNIAIVAGRRAIDVPRRGELSRESAWRAGPASTLVRLG